MFSKLGVPLPEPVVRKNITPPSAQTFSHEHQHLPFAGIPHISPIAPCRNAVALSCGPFPAPPPARGSSPSPKPATSPQRGVTESCCTSRRPRPTPPTELVPVSFSILLLRRLMYTTRRSSSSPPTIRGKSCTRPSSRTRRPPRFGASHRR